MTVTSEDKEYGAALLSVLLLVAIMSVAALAMFETTMTSVRHARLTDGRAQIAWQVSGAEEAGLSVLQEISETTRGVVTLNTPGLGVPVITGARGAQTVATLEDDSNCFNLNALRTQEDTEDFGLGGDGLEGVSPEGAGLDVFGHYQNLLLSAGFSERVAEALVATLADWLDPDSTTRLNGAESNYYASLRPAAYRASGVPLAGVSELRAVRGYDQEVFQTLLPLVCARATSEMAVLNLNTLTPEQAPLLSMVFSAELEPEEAVRIINDRPAVGWTSIDDLFQFDATERIAPAFRTPDLMSLTSSHFRLRGRVTSGDLTTGFKTFYTVSDTQLPRITRRTYGGG